MANPDSSGEEDPFSLEGMLHYLDPKDTGFAFNLSLLVGQCCSQGVIDYLEWTNLLRLEHLNKLTARCRQSGPLKHSVLTDWEITASIAMSERIDTLAARASELGVRLMIDAEQTYFQPAIGTHEPNIWKID